MSDIYITENDCSATDVPAADGLVYDTDRIMFAQLPDAVARFSKSSFSKRANAVSSVCRRRPNGSNARPKRASNNVMLVIQRESAPRLQRPVPELHGQVPQSAKFGK